MQLPVDIPAVLKAATDIEGASKTPLAVSVYIDETAPGDLVAFARSAFASASPSARVAISYVSGGEAQACEGDDMAVVVAGVSEQVGENAERLREAGVPTMVLSTMPSLAHDMAEAFGHPIPEGDLCAPDGADAPSPVRALLDRLQGKQAEADGTQMDLAADVAEATEAFDEPMELDEEASRALEERMGRWVCAACADKRLAFALAFPFVRRPLAIDSVRATSMQNAAVGVVAFIPGADMPIMTLNQMKMLLQIAAAYGQPLNWSRAKELAAVVGGAFLLRNVARTAVGVVPVLGWAIRGGIGYAGTEAMGRAAVDYFEGGGSLGGLASVVRTAGEEAVRTARKAADTPAGRSVLQAAKDLGSSAVASLREAGRR